MMRWPTDDVAHGFERRHRTMPMVTVSFDRELMTRIQQLAVERGTSFAEQVRTLCGQALEGDKSHG
jgi:hypothetical protein